MTSISELQNEQTYSVRNKSSSSQLKNISSERESVKARETAFMNYIATEHDATMKKGAPILLKPNGAPIFAEELERTERKKAPEWEKDSETGEWLQRTIKRSEVEESRNVNTSTVKAHNFKIAPRTVNQTAITVLDMQRNTETTDTAAPVKVLYVKPEISKRKSHRDELDPAKFFAKPPRARKSKDDRARLDLTGPRDRDLDNNLFDVSGIFKKRAISETERRIISQRAYSAKVRAENKIKIKPQKSKDREEQLSPDGLEVQTTMDEDPKLRLPHSQNRFKGEFSNLDLFRRAKEALLKEKMEKEQKEAEITMKKQNEKEYMNALMERNRQLVKPSSQPNVLKRREEEYNQAMKQMEMQLQRAQKREKRAQRKSEGRSTLGLEQANRSKLRKLQAQKQEKAFLQELELRQKAEEARQKRYNDLSREREKSFEIKMRQEQQEDNFAQPLVDRKALLAEQRQRRRMQEVEKKQQEFDESQRKLINLHRLEETRRQIFADTTRPTSKKGSSLPKKMPRSAKNIEHKKETRGRSEQLVELKDWIDGQIEVTQLDQPVQVNSPKSQPRSNSQKATMDASINADPHLTKHSLPGNSLIPSELERATQARKNRYGLSSDNGFDDMAQRQMGLAGIDLPGEQETALNFTNEAAPSPPKAKAVLPPKVKKGGRKIINEPVDDTAFSPSRGRQPVAGMMNIKEEAYRQKLEEDKRRYKAAVEIQRRARGWKDRKATRHLRETMRADIEEDHRAFIDKYKHYDGYNLNRFYSQKQKLRAQIGTDDIEESINEQIGDSTSFPHGSMPEGGVQRKLMQKVFYEPTKTMERDPYSLINLYVQKHAPPAPRESKPDRQMKRRTKKRSKKLSTSRDIEEDLPQVSSSQPAEIDEEIEKYSSDYSEIHESLPSKQKPSSRDIEESIPESIVNASSPSKHQTVEESITEESAIRRSVPKSEEIEDEIPDAVPEASESVISEESAIKSKVERARDNIVDDFDRQGVVDLSGPMRAQQRRAELAREAEIRAKNQEDAYRNSRQIIEDFEEEHKMKDHGAGSAHDRLLKGLTEEMKRYETAVSGQMFAEQFTGIVNKSLAQKDMMMLGQRLSQLEAENRHKQEIADIRAEQIRMLSQLMLLTSQGNAGAPSGEQMKQQKELMRNIKSIIEQPMPQGPSGDVPIGESMASKKSAQVFDLHKNTRQYMKDQSTKFSNKPAESIAEDLPSQIEEDDDIVDEVGSMGNGSPVEDSIKESISASASKDLAHARHVIGSEKAIIQKNRDIVEQAPKSRASPFKKTAFQDYQDDKYKEIALAGGDQMGEYLLNIEQAVLRKKEQETVSLQKQLDTRKISPRTFKNRKTDLEKWVQRERAELSEKRQTVETAADEIKRFVARLEEERKLTLDAVLATTPKLQKTTVSDSANLLDVKEQLDSLKTTAVEKPETKYLNKKREFVRQLLNEKREAIERGVQDEMARMEGEMIDDMMRTALSLDVDQEIERRVKLARSMVEASGHDQSSKVSESLAKSVSQHSKPLVDESSKSVSKSGTLGNKKKVQFSTDTKQLSVAEDSIRESIAESIVEESMGQSSASKLKDSSARMSGSKKKTPSKISVVQEESDSLDRGSEDVQKQVDASVEKNSAYTNDFISESIASGSSETEKLKSASVLQSKIEDSAGYSEAFEEISQSHTIPKSLKAPKIDPVQEEDSVLMESEAPSASLDDREILESTRSVDWQIKLQDKFGPVPLEESEQEVMTSQSPSNKSPEASGDVDEMLADQITDALMENILTDYYNGNTRCEVEDDIDESRYEDKWPYNLEAKQAAAEEARKKKDAEETAAAKKAFQEAQAKQEEEAKRAEKEAKEKHDALIRKAEEQRKEMADQRKATEEYLQFLVKTVDPEVIQSALSRPIEHDPLRMLEKIQAFDLDDATIEMTNTTLNQQQQVLPSILFDELERAFDPAMDSSDPNMSAEARSIHHLAIFDAFNEALDQERPYKVKGMPNPWSKQTRMTQEVIGPEQVQGIIERSIKRVAEWDKTGAGTRYAPPPPPPPVNDEAPAPEQQDEEERNKFERQERLGHLLTAEVHAKEGEWLDYETEDTQVRFDVADMILEELADEVTNFLIAKGNLTGQIGLLDSGNDYNDY